MHGLASAPLAWAGAGSCVHCSLNLGDSILDLPVRQGKTGRDTIGTITSRACMSEPLLLQSGSVILSFQTVRHSD